jgi:hypothetical protein
LCGLRMPPDNIPAFYRAFALILSPFQSNAAYSARGR